MMVGANISTDQLLSIAERTIMEADEDKVFLVTSLLDSHTSVQCCGSGSISTVKRGKIGHRG
jgi:hypothetical protein